MKEITIEYLKECAKRLMFEMSDSEYQTLFEEFKTIKSQMELISKNEELDKLEPLTFPYLIFTSTLREDIPATPIKREEALKNASNVVGGQIKIKKVI